MTSKKSGTATPKRRKKPVKKVTPMHVPMDPLPPVKEMQLALVCANENNRRWLTTGLASSAMARYAREAAWQCRGPRCFFCGKVREPVSLEKLFLFHLQYPLCECLSPLREVSRDYLENWFTPEGNKKVLENLATAVAKPDDPVYQYYCIKCSDGPNVVTYREVARSLRLHHMHGRRKLCTKCFSQTAAKRAQLQRAMEVEAAHAKNGQAVKTRIEAARTRSGPGAKINKIKTANHSHGQEIPPLKPLNEVLTDQQLEDLDKKALEKVNGL